VKKHFNVRYPYSFLKDGGFKIGARQQNMHNTKFKNFCCTWQNKYNHVNHLNSMHGTTKQAHTKLVKEYLTFHTSIEHGVHELSDLYNQTLTPAKFVNECLTPPIFTTIHPYASTYLVVTECPVYLPTYLSR
jgi:hypothetical protein